MKCLDSDLLVAILRGKEQARRKMRELDSAGRAATTSVNAFEVIFGAFRSQQE